MNLLIWASSSNNDIKSKTISTYEAVFSKPLASPMLGQALKMSLRVPFVLILILTFFYCYQSCQIAYLALDLNILKSAKIQTYLKYVVYLDNYEQNCKHRHYTRQIKNSKSGGLLRAHQV